VEESDPMTPTTAALHLLAAIFDDPTDEADEALFTPAGLESLRLLDAAHAHFQHRLKRRAAEIGRAVAVARGEGFGDVVTDVVTTRELTSVSSKIYYGNQVRYEGTLTMPTRYLFDADAAVAAERQLKYERDRQKATAAAPEDPKVVEKRERRKRYEELRTEFGEGSYDYHTPNR
jgi:hypothetical protein